MKHLSAIYIMHSLNSLAGAMIGVFVPVYLLKLGYGLRDVLVFYAIIALAVFLSFIAAGIFSSRIGLKKILIAYLPFLLVFVWMLYGLEDSAIPLSLIAVIGGIQSALYWMPLHLFFMNHAFEHKMGESVGKLFAFPQIVCIFAPLAGGAIAASGGFPLLFASAGAIYVLSAIPLFFIPDAFPKAEFKIEKIAAFLKKHTRYIIAETANYFQKSLETVVWPIFIFLAFRNVFSIGAIGALLAAGSFFFMIMIGSHSDRGGKRKIVKTGALIMAVIWLARSFVAQETAFYILTLLAGFFGALILIPFNAYAYNIAKKDNAAEFILFREIPVLAGRLAAYGLAFFFADNLDISFIAAALSGIFFFFI